MKTRKQIREEERQRARAAYARVLGRLHRNVYKAYDRNARKFVRLNRQANCHPYYVPTSLRPFYALEKEMQRQDGMATLVNTLVHLLKP